MHGLYDGDFVGFRTATDHELEVALNSAVVAVDANVLLNLYRFRAQTSRDLIKVLERLGDRLVVPHQSLREFWRHRQRNAASPRAATLAAEDALGKAARLLNAALETWAKQVGVDADELSALSQKVERFASGMKDELSSVYQDASSKTPGVDPILADLERLLEGRVTDAMAEDEWDRCLAEAHRRIEAEEPPGFKDAAKEEGDSAEGGAGDYLVWYQATRHAASMDSDLIIVTADEKEDWWWRQHAAFLGPRPELTLEFHTLCGKRLFLLRPSDLLARAAALHVEVDEKSAADADRSAKNELAEVPWSADGLTALLGLLDREAPVQAAALRLAGSNEAGVVTREQVYELGDFPDDRMLRGFTRPYRRLTEALQEMGRIPAGVAPVFVARYPDGVKTSYFSVPPEIPIILRSRLGTAEAHSGDSSEVS